jgi:nitrite reductase (NADH) small subunit
MTTSTTTEYLLGSLALIPPGEGRTFQVGERRVAVFHARNGSLYANQAECPHRGGPLADGLLGATTVICPLHGWKFDIATGEPRMGTCGITTYSVRLAEKGEIVLTLDDERIPLNETR